MSKKLAAGAQAIVLDVKVGDGAFMKTIEDAQLLAEVMLSLGARAEREVVCLLTDMDQPLGAAVGNALEVREALETVRGNGPPDFTELVLDASSRLLALSDLGIDEREGRRRVEAAVADGSAEGAWHRWIEAQGGTTDEDALPVAPVIRPVTAPEQGTFAAWARSGSAMRRCISAPGAGRRRTRSTTRSASSATRSAETVSRRATCWPRSTRATRRARPRPRPTCSPPTSSGRSRPRTARCCSKSSGKGISGAAPGECARTNPAVYCGARHPRFDETRRLTAVPGTCSWP